MTSRGTFSNLLVSLPVAFFSGLGVAVSLLDEQTSSLVGVAISASLLPPAVNAGILWICHSFAKRGTIPEPPPYFGPVPYIYNPEGAQPPIPNPYGRGNPLDVGDICDDEEDSDCYYELKDYYVMGLNSLFITLANIALIMISSMLM